MSSLIDCPECACLFRATDATCPFCGHASRHTLGSSAFGSSWAVVAFSASLGVLGVACQDDKDPIDADSVTETITATGTDSDSSSDSGTTVSTNPGGETIDPNSTTSSDGATYAGPDESWTTWWDTTTTTSDSTSTSTSTGTTGTTTTTAGSSTTNPDASTYAGPDETWGTDGSTTSTSDASTYAGPDETSI